MRTLLAVPNQTSTTAIAQALAWLVDNNGGADASAGGASSSDVAEKRCTAKGFSKSRL